MKKIDVHCHTTNRILKDAANSDASLEAIAAQMKEYDIIQTVLLATYFPQRGTGISNYRLHHWIEGRSEFSMFGSLDFAHFFYQGYNELEEVADEGLIRGIKLYTAYQPIDFNSDRFKQIAALASEKRLPLMFHGGVSYILWKELGIQGVLALATSANPPLPQAAKEPYKTPLEFERVAQTFPAVNIIVSHLCKPFFEEMIAVLKRNDNIFTDMSGILDSKSDSDYRAACVEQVRKFVGECGPGKIMFGTDFPVQTHADSVDFVEKAMKDYAVKDKQAVYFDNANRIIFNGLLSLKNYLSLK